ncbi:MAG: alpha/beta fold hydrolase [Spirochaetaceae bacterium]|nr:MAG: alpha/beta fold hydrolase [Spirochaetaceae bacterium]
MSTADHHTTTLPASQPFHLSGGEHAVLLIHGFTGSPHDMRFLGNTLNEAGFTVSCPRLPGHGTDGNDFLQTTERDWERRVLDAYYDLAGRHARVSVCGLSMGGVLGVLLASTVPVHSLVLAAPALLVKNRLVPFARFIGPFVKRKAITPHNTYDDQPEIRRLVDEYWSWQWNMPVARLYRLMRRARKRLGQVQAPTLTIVSTQDNTVPTETASYLAARIGSAVHAEHTLTHSGHVLTNDSERDLVARLSIDWITRGDEQTP